ncbi:MAG: tetratricopeptide repeat protein [Lentisphaerales bacterium]|nr:tetratricopeptide repeat protein [Lentisphaerales bacterium]
MRLLGITLLLLFSVTAQEKKEKRTNPALQEETKGDQELWVFAEGLYSRTWYKDALAEYKSFLNKFPDSSLAQNARWRIYECHEKLGNEDEVLVSLDEYISHESNLTHKERARMNKARLLFADRKYDGALKIFEAINRKVDKGSLWESARYESARIYLQQAKPGEAFLRFRQLASLGYKGTNQTRAYAIFAYASLLSERGKAKDALKQYSRLTLQKGTDPEIAENSWYNQGMIYFQVDQQEQARRSFEHVIQNYPNGRFKENSVNQAARCELGLGRPLEALQVLGLNADSAGVIQLEAQYLTAYAYQQLKEYSKAVAFYEKCIEAEGDAFKENCWFNKLNCLSAWGKSKEALAHARLMVKLYPESVHLADVCYTAGLEAEKIKEFVSAEALLRMSLKKFNGKWSYLDSAYFALARVLSEQKKYSDEAQIWEELSLRVDSEYRGSAFIRGGEAWINASKPGKALAVFKKYLVNFSDGKEAFFVKNRIVEVLLIEQRYDDAVVFLKEMLAAKVKDSEKAVLQSVLGRVYYYQGKFKEAVTALELCLKEEGLEESIKSDCRIFLGFSKISLDQEKAGVVVLAKVFKTRDEFKSLLSANEEITVASLLEKYKYSEVARKVYQRLALSQDRKLQMAGLLGQARMSVVGGKYSEGVIPLKKTLQLCGDQDNKERVDAMSLLGEIYAYEGKKDQAFQTFEFALKIKAGDEESICRILYGMAKILLERKDVEAARRYANQVFILYKDPVYAPKSMFLSIEASLLNKKKKEAIQTAKELKGKFPLYFAKIEVQDYLKAHGINTD